MTENREYKSDVFSLIMGVPRYALQTYNILNHTELDNPDEVKMERLESGISLSRRNDASFIVNADLNFYEHQSTYNPNMPLRGLIYFVGAMKDFIKGRDLFGRTQIKIPVPHFVVFYNGLELRPEVEYLKLSDSFMKPTDDPDLELKCVVYNINKGYNTDMISNCEALRGYMMFVEQVRKYDAKADDPEDAVEKAIQYCIDHNVLRDFFIENREEVSKMAIIDMTWEKREPIIRREEREKGISIGERRGEQRGERRKTIQVYQNCLERGLSEEDAVAISGITEEQRKALRDV